jgi:membrane-associated phospholipid phosphatase
VSRRRRFLYLIFFLVPHLAIYFLIQSMLTRGEYDFMTPLDMAIPFVPDFIWIYHSLVPVILLTTLILVRTKKVFFDLYLACIMSGFLLSTLHVLFPSFYPRAEIDIDTTSAWLVHMTRLVDAPSNAFPSTHVVYSWLMAFGAAASNLCLRYPILRKVYYLWAALVTASTLFLKQHFILDAIVGIIIAVAFFKLSRKIVTRVIYLYERRKNGRMV